MGWGASCERNEWAGGPTGRGWECGRRGQRKSLGCCVENGSPVGTRVPVCGRRGRPPISLGLRAQHRHVLDRQHDDAQDILCIT